MLITESGINLAEPRSWRPTVTPDSPSPAPRARPRRGDVARPFPGAADVLPNSRSDAEHALPPPGRRRLLAAALAVGLVVLVVGVTVAVGVVRSIDTPLAVGAWSAHRTASTTPVTDAGGTRWEPDAGLAGGTPMAFPAAADLMTGSPQLYTAAREGATSWTVQVPQDGRYAVDLLLVPASGTRVVGDTAFDVAVEDGRGGRTVLRHDVDPLVGVPNAPLHVTGLAEIAGTTLTVRVEPTRGQAAVAGLVVTSASPGDPAALVADEFDGTSGSAPPAHWQNETGSGPWGDTEGQGYTADRAHSALDGKGNLVITATRDPYTDEYGTREYTSARLNTLGKAAITYGRIEARLQAPPGQGMWSAIWAMGTNRPQVDWPRSGEIDVVEHLAAQPSTVYGFVHGLGDDRDPPGYKDQPVSSFGGPLGAGKDLTSAMHVYAVDIQPGAVTFSLDGVPYFTSAEADLRAGQSWPIGHPYYLIANLAVGGWLGPADAGTPFPGRLVIDRVSATGWL